MEKYKPIIPVQLTDDHFFKFGFKKDYYFNGDDEIENWSKDDDMFCFEKCGLGGYYIDIISAGHVFYVNELIDLYFALTKKKLTIVDESNHNNESLYNV